MKIYSISPIQQNTSDGNGSTESTSSSSSSTLAASEYFGIANSDSTPKKRKNDDVLDYIKKRDKKKIMSQNKMLIKLLKKSLENEGNVVSDTSNDSNSD